MGRRGRKGNRRGNKNNGGNRKGGSSLPRETDLITVKGQLVLPTLATTTTPTANLVAINLAPDTLGDRPAAFGGLFARYRFTSVTVHYVPIVPVTTTGAIAFGLADDVDDSELSSSATSYAGITALRRSFETQVYSKGHVVWRPIDMNRWYYASADSTNPEPRFTKQLALFVTGLSLPASTTLGTIIIRYNIQFAGAIPVSTVQ